MCRELRFVCVCLRSIGGENCDTRTRGLIYSCIACRERKQRQRVAPCKFSLNVAIFGGLVCKLERTGALYVNCACRSAGTTYRSSPHLTVAQINHGTRTPDLLIARHVDLINWQTRVAHFAKRDWCARCSPPSHVLIDTCTVHSAIPKHLRPRHNYRPLTCPLQSPFVSGHVSAWARFLKSRRGKCPLLKERRRGPI